MTAPSRGRWRSGRRTARRDIGRGVAAVTAIALTAAACGGQSATDDVGADADADAVPAGTAGDVALEGEFRLGYFPNVTHAPAIVGDRATGTSPRRSATASS